jgi:WD40 repeat protein
MGNKNRDRRIHELLHPLVGETVVDEMIAIRDRYSNKVVVVSSDGKKLWETENLPGRIWSIKWSPNKDFLAVGGDFNKVIVFDRNGNKVWESGDLGGCVENIEWFSDGSGFVVTGGFNEVILFEKQQLPP